MIKVSYPTIITDRVSSGPLPLCPLYLWISIVKYFDSDQSRPILHFPRKLSLHSPFIMTPAQRQSAASLVWSATAEAMKNTFHTNQRITATITPAIQM